MSCPGMEWSVPRAVDSLAGVRGPDAVCVRASACSQKARGQPRLPLLRWSRLALHPPVVATVDCSVSRYVVPISRCAVCATALRALGFSGTPKQAHVPGLRCGVGDWKRSRGKFILFESPNKSELFLRFWLTLFYQHVYQKMFYAFPSRRYHPLRGCACFKSIPFTSIASSSGLIVMLAFPVACGQ